MYRLLTLDGGTGKYRVLCEVNAEEAAEMAQCFLEDPRDDIRVVYVYDDDNQQFRGWYRRNGKERQSCETRSSRSSSRSSG